MLRGFIFFLILTTLVVSPKVNAARAVLPVSIYTTDKDHPIWKAGAELSGRMARSGFKLAPDLAKPGDRQVSAQEHTGMAVIALEDFTRQVPATQVLQLPFVFADIGAAHAALDGPLGEALRVEARAAGWELLTFWDEGMQVLSGNRRYNQAINLTGMEFLLLQPDSIAENQFRALDAWTRIVRPESQKQLHAECIVGSREATPLQLARERMDRVHLDLSLTRHRYDAWVVAMPVVRWRALGRGAQRSLQAALQGIQPWQRQLAEQADAQAVDQLAGGGMQIHRLSLEQRMDFIRRLPPPEQLVKNSLGAEHVQRLLALVQLGLPQARDAGSGAEPQQPLPDSPDRQP